MTSSPEVAAHSRHYFSILPGCEHTRQWHPFCMKETLTLMKLTNAKDTWSVDHHNLNQCYSYLWRVTLSQSRMVYAGVELSTVYSLHIYATIPAHYTSVNVSCICNIHLIAFYILEFFPFIKFLVYLNSEFSNLCESLRVFPPLLMTSSLIFMGLYTHKA